MKQTKRWKVAVVGCGSIAGEIYLPQLKTFPNVEVVAVCDIIPERAESYAQRFDVPAWYPNIDQLLAKCDFEILMDTASIPAHHELNMKALRAGKHLYSQKPVGLTVEQVTQQIEAAQEHHVKFAASAIHPLRPDIMEIRNMVERGTLGKITLMRTHTAHGGPEYFQYREADCSWFFQPGAGALYDMGVHGITMAVAVLGPAKEVGCMAAVSEPERTIRSGAFDGKKVKADYLPDNYIITLNWGNGTIGVVDAGFSQRASTVNQLEVYGTKGTATIEGQIKIGEGDGIKAYIDDENLKIRGWMRPMPQENVHPGEFKQAEAVLDLIRAIETDTTPVLDPRIARHVVEIMCTIPEAIEKKCVLPLHTTF